MNQSQMKKAALKAHKAARGKIEVIGRVPVKDSKALSIYYTPGVAFASLAIKQNPLLSYEYTGRSNTIAILTDGSRILGLGNIGPEAGMPVMEGKSLLLKKFGGVDAIPMAIASRTKQDTIKFAQMIAPSLGAINIEDIRSPDCVEILKELESSLDIPVFHDDNQGTGIVAYAALINALKLVQKKINNIKIVMNGAGAAGYGITHILLAAGAREVIMCDTQGTIYKTRKQNMNSIKRELSRLTNKDDVIGNLADAVKDADVIIGASSQGMFDPKLIPAMADDPIVFALANPYPEIDYAEAKKAGATIVGTGRSDRPNQVNNMLAFPGVFRGLLDVRAKKVNMQMNIAAARAIAEAVSSTQLSKEYIVPRFGDNEQTMNVIASSAAAVAAAAIKSGVARKKISPKAVSQNTKALFRRYQKIERRIIKQ